MKPQHFAALAGSLLLVALVLLFSGRPVERKAPEEAPAVSRTVTVTGEGETRVRPDLALVTFGVVMHRASAAEAEALALASAGQIKEALVQAGAAADGVELSNLTLTTNTYTDFAGVTRISGFHASVAVQAEVQTLNRVQAVLDAGLAAGATSLERVIYTLESPEAAKQAAMRAARENAGQRAAMLIKGEEGKLGELIHLEVLMEDAPTTALSPGTLTFRARVKATFQF